MIERRRCLGFVDESLLRRRIRVQMSRENLDRYRPVELRVLGLVDNPHAASAELRDDLVLRYG